MHKVGVRVYYCTLYVLLLCQMQSLCNLLSIYIYMLSIYIYILSICTSIYLCNLVCNRFDSWLVSCHATKRMVLLHRNVQETGKCPGCLWLCSCTLDLSSWWSMCYQTHRTMCQLTDKLLDIAITVAHTEWSSLCLLSKPLASPQNKKEIINLWTVAVNSWPG